MLTSKRTLAFGIAALVVAIDRFTKALVAGRMELHESIPIVPGLFSLTYVRNTGAAFGILAGRFETWRVPFFLAVSVTAVVLLLWFLRGVPAERRSVILACGAVLGGAIGNMIDRAAFGEVIDFLDLHVADHHWPFFNVADTAITLGVVVLCLDALCTPVTEREGAKPG